MLGDFSKLKEVVESSLGMIAAFLKGLFDADGSVSGRKLYLYNSDFLLLCYAQKLLAKFGVETTGPYLSTKRGSNSKSSRNSKVYERKRNVYCIYIRAESLRRFYEKVGFRLERKQRRLKEAIGLP